MSCGKILKEGQWWHFCGETDMGQTAPALCEECEPGGFKLASPEIQAEHQRKKAERMAELEKERGAGTVGGYLYTGEGRNEIQSGIGEGGGLVWIKKRPEVTLGMQPKWFMVKQEDGTTKMVDNPDYVEPPPPTEPDEEDDDDNPFNDWRQGYAGFWKIPAPFGATMLQCERKPSWIKRMAVKWATGWTWEDYK